MLAGPEPAPRQIGSWAEARDLLFANSTDLRLARAELHGAQGRREQARSMLLPQISATTGLAVDLRNRDSAPVAGAGSLTARGRPPTSPAATASLRAEQPLFDAPAWHGLSSAKAYVDAAEASVDEVRRELYQRLTGALVAVVAAERAAALNRVGLRLALERAALTRRTYELGRATQLDAIRVDQDVPVARAALVVGDEQLRQAREALGLLLGVPGQVGVSPELALDGLVDELRATCSRLDEGAERADLEAAEARVRAAREARRQARAGYLPRVAISTEAVAATTDPGPFTLGGWSIVALLSVPIWEGGFRGGLVEERAALVDQAQQREVELRRTFDVELARARRSESVARSLLDATTRARDLAAETDAMTRRSFTMGRATSLELVQSATALRQAELNLALREYEWVNARLDAWLTEARCR
ncbi:MAG: TolC family protein [Deltaproteobacteria bacterium]|nr:TolC family protein [Deltaproteobacteria bacterium]